jgi:capsular polysaccharide export protein
MSADADQGWSRFAGQRVLLLQGPHGRFFPRVASSLLRNGALSVHQVVFNGGDWLFALGSQAEKMPYRQAMDQWPRTLDAWLHKLNVDAVVVFGDCRPIHVAARAVCRAQGVAYWVFEEGYVRPDYITLERDGVNGHTQLPATREAYDNWHAEPHAPAQTVGKTFWNASWAAVAYFMAACVLKPWFSHYQHHRRLSIWDGLHWVRSLWRKHWYRWREANALHDLRGHAPDGDRSYFLAVLQVSTDSQLQVHSRFKSVAEFIDAVVASFAKQADSEAVLLIKHHPMDRGYADYSRLIQQLSRAHGLAGRIRYIHDQHLPSLMAHAEGVVTVNSTVGLSALHHGTPVKTLGQAVYDMAGLTCQAPLDVFWREAARHAPEPRLYTQFINYVIIHTQINGSFYARLPVQDAAGVHFRLSRPASLPAASFQIEPPLPQTPVVIGK